jgi:hypothetical protein
MNIFRNKKNIKPEWFFSQTGNLWRFIFGGDNIIVGETRDLKERKVYFFTVDIKSGKTLLKDFLFEDGNYWISIEGATSDIVFLHRYEKPELPYHKNIIALDIRTGNKLWENDYYLYLFNTKSKLYAYKQKFESTDIVELNMNDGSVIRKFAEDENTNIHKIREANDDLFLEFTDYPVKLENSCNENILSITKEETGNNKIKGNIEYIVKNNLLIFNYYVSSGIDLNDINRNIYENRFCIYDLNSGEKIFSDILNKKSMYDVPDNFFVKDNFLFYLREKKEIVAIKII